jgi:hypothetical protein
MLVLGDRARPSAASVSSLGGLCVRACVRVFLAWDRSNSGHRARQASRVFRGARPRLGSGRRRGHAPAGFLLLPCGGYQLGHGDTPTPRTTRLGVSRHGPARPASENSLLRSRVVFATLVQAALPLPRKRHRRGTGGGTDCPVCVRVHRVSLGIKGSEANVPLPTPALPTIPPHR